MVLKAKGKIWLPRATSRGGARVYISSKIVSDSQWPLTKDGTIEVEIDVENGYVILRPVDS